jgi:NADH-quinone oxidoreductase subunit L
MNNTFPLYWIPLLPLLGAAFNLLVGRKLSRATVHLVGVGSVLSALIVGLVATFRHLYPLWAAAHQAHPAGSSGAAPALVSNVFDWISSGAVTIKLGLLLDPLSAVMVLIITFVGWLIHVYSMGYMKHDDDVARFFGYLNLFVAAMLLLVLGDNLVVLFVGWEGVGLCSYLLIGFWYDKDGTTKPGDANATAGRKAFIVNRVGDFAFILGLLLLFSIAGTLNINELASQPGKLLYLWTPWGTTHVVSVAAVAGLLLLIGATGKSAQIPLYVWLPDAMAGPTPVSALIHAATMVTAGVYMVARMNFLYMLTPTVMGVVALIGAVTALFAATIGFAQNDIKKVLAYSTISQLGYMFVGVGVGAYSAGVFHLFTHSFFKACLFLGAGAVIHAMSGEQDIRKMGGLARKLPITHATFLVSCIAIAGLPPLSGFFSKDEILWQALSTANPGWPLWFPALLYVLVVAGALCTAFYMFRLYFLTFTGESRADVETQQHVREAPVSMTMPLVVLALGAAALGVLGLPSQRLNLFHQWLAPVVERGAHLVAGQPRVAPVQDNALAHTSLEFWLLALSVGVAALGLYIAYRLYNRGASPAVERLTSRIPRLLRVVQAKYWVDEIYHAIFVHPVRWLSVAFWKGMDAFVIDLVGVNGSAWVVDAVGRVSRRLHNGNIQRTIVGVVVGVSAIVVLVSCPPHAFQIQVASAPPAAERDPKVATFGVLRRGQKIRVGQRLVFDASREFVGDQRQLEYRWDFDGDGAWDTPWSATATATHTFARKETFKVKLLVRDRRWGTTATESRKVEVQ